MTAMLHKNDALYFLYVVRVYPRVECPVVSLQLSKMFNNALVTSAHYFMYFKLCLGWNSDIDKLVFVKLVIQKTIL